MTHFSKREVWIFYVVLTSTAVRWFCYVFSSFSMVLTVRILAALGTLMTGMRVPR